MSPAPRALRQFARHRLAGAGLVVVLRFMLAASLAPWLAPHDPLATSGARIRQRPPGRTLSVLTRRAATVLWKARASLLTGAVAAGFAALIDVPVGLLAGLAIVAGVLAFTRVGDGLRDALDPRSVGGR